ncbi:MAG: MFS transporter [Oligoflexales bacterium]
MNQKLLIVLSYWFSTFVEGATRIIIPLYLTSIGITATKIAVIFFLFEAFGLFTNIYAGFFINRYGYKLSFVLSLLMHTCASIIFVCVEPGMLPMTVLGISSIAHSLRGVAKELIKTTSSAYIKQGESKSRVIQVLLGGKDTTKGIGILCGGFLLTWFNFHSSFYFLGMITFCVLVVSILWIEDFREKKKADFKDFWNPKSTMKTLAFSRAFLYAGRDFWLVVAIPVYASQTNISQTEISGLLAFGLICFGLIQPSFGNFMKIKFSNKNKWKNTEVLWVLPAILAPIPLMLLVTTLNIWSLAIIIAFYNILAGMATVPHNSLHVKFARKKRASVDISYYKTIGQIGKTIAVLASGYLFDVFGLTGCLIASSSSLFMSSVMSFSLRKTKQEQETVRKEKR